MHLPIARATARIPTGHVYDHFATSLAVPRIVADRALPQLKGAVDSVEHIRQRKPNFGLSLIQVEHYVFGSRGAGADGTDKDQ